MPVHDKNGREMSDAEVQAVAKRWWDEYLEKWVRSVASHEEMLEKRVGADRLEQMRQAETVQEGYYD